VCVDILVKLITPAVYILGSTGDSLLMVESTGAQYEVSVDILVKLSTAC